MIILSEFESRYKPQAAEVIELDNWDELVELLYIYSELKFAAKEDACLIQTIKFHTDYRLQKNAQWLYAMFLDFDGGYSAQECLARLDMFDLEAVLYSTGSNMKDGETEKFRCVVPLTDKTNAQNMWALWDSMDNCFEEKTDASKNDPSSHFYVPGQYDGAENFITHVAGDIHSYEWWIERFPVEISRKGRIKKPSKKLAAYRRRKQENENRRKQAANPDWIKHLPLIETAWEDDYFNTSGEARYHARMKLFMRIAGRYSLKGEYLDADDLASIYDGLDYAHPEGPRHQTPDKHKGVVKDAQKCINAV